MIKTEEIPVTRDDVLKWMKHGSVKPKGRTEIPAPEYHKCPKSDTCVMDCYHKKPHTYDESFCNDKNGQCNTKCVHELWSDITFFEDDFKV